MSILVGFGITVDANRLLTPILRDIENGTRCIVRLDMGVAAWAEKNP